jgi:hypothetical protein
MSRFADYLLLCYSIPLCIVTDALQLAVRRLHSDSIPCSTVHTSYICAWCSLHVLTHGHGECRDMQHCSFLKVTVLLAALECTASVIQLLQLDYWLYDVRCASLVQVSQLSRCDERTTSQLAT